MDYLKLVKKILNNDYLTYFVGFFTILFVMEILNSPNNNLILLIKHFLNFKIILVLSVLVIIFVSYFNIPLSLLLLTNLLFLMNIKYKVETFQSRIPDLIDKNSLISYKKNFADLKKQSNKKKSDIDKKKSHIDKKNEEKKTEKYFSNKNYKVQPRNTIEEKEEIKFIKYSDEAKNTVNNERLDIEEDEKNDYDIKNELKKIQKDNEESKEKENTLEDDLEKKNYEIKKDWQILEDDSSEFTDSSESSLSSELSNSSDSDKMDDISMDEARISDATTLLFP